MGSCISEDNNSSSKDPESDDSSKTKKHWEVKMGDDDKKQAKLADSNMANHGSKEHREKNKNAAGKEDAWVNMDKSCGIQIWRIEKFEIVKWPKKQYGQFHTGDSYIVLHTMKDDESEKLLYDVYFWLGAETTQDEAGTAAYKTVELDDYLDDEPVQYREVQGNETKSFLDLFPKINILSGGIDSGFNHVEKQKFSNKLLHIAGYGKNIQVYQVQINVNSMNNGDAFILDTGDILYQFNGNKASKDEKWRAMQVVNEIKSNRGKCDLILIDGLNDKSDDAKSFWSIIGCSDDINIADDDDDDDDGKMDIELVMEKISNESGHMEVNEIERGKTLNKSNLDTKDCFIVDGGKALYVWCGKKSNKSEKRAAMQNAVDYLKNQGRDLSVPISRQIEGRESDSFWKIFEGTVHGGRKHMASKWKSWFN